MSSSGQESLGRRHPDHDDLAATMQSPLAKQVIAIAIGAALVLVVTALGASAMKHIGKAPDAQLAENGANPDADVSAVCRARNDSTGFGSVQRETLGSVAGTRHGDDALARHAGYIDCLMSEQPSRLCQREHRTHLVNTIRTYYKLRSSMAASLPGSTPDPRIVSGLTHLIQDGYLARSALGGFLDMGMPRELRVALKGVKRERKSCG
jgi:hypothetical protein